MPSNHDQWQVVHIRRRRFPHPHCTVRVNGRDYQVPIPNRVGWSSNAPPRKGMNWCPSPRMKGETAELSKLMQKKREEKTTSKVSVSSKKERGRRFNREEKAKVSAQNVVAAVQVKVAPKPGDNLLKATTETQVITAMIGLRPGQNLFREKTRGPPPKQKESQESQVLTKLKKFTKKDQELMLARFADMLDLLTFDIVKGRGEMEQQKAKKAKEKVPTKKAIEKAAAEAADKKAAEDAMTKAAAGAADADKKSVEEAHTETVVAPEPNVKDTACGSAVTAEPVPEELLPQIAEPKEAEAIVAAVVELGAVEKEVGRLKLEIERLIEVGRERQRALKQLDDDVESIFARLGELESGEAKAAAAEVLERRFIALEDQVREAKAREVAKPEAAKVDAHLHVETLKNLLSQREALVMRLVALENHLSCLQYSDRKNYMHIKEVDNKRKEHTEHIFNRLGELESGEAKAAAAEVLERRLSALEDQVEEAKAREVAKPETLAVEVLVMRLVALENHVLEEAKAKEVAKPATVAVEESVEEQSFERRLLTMEISWQRGQASDRRIFRRLDVLEDQVYQLYAPQRAEDAQRAEWARQLLRNREYDSD